MRRLLPVLFLSAIFGVSCQRGSGLCPQGMHADGDSDARVLWCKASQGTARRWIELYSASLRRQSCGYEAGRAEGDYAAWHPNGKRWLEGHYRTGAKEGAWTQWDKDGNRVAEGEYRAGTLISGAPVGLVALCEKQTPP
jgi:hypothetical protein